MNYICPTSKYRKQVTKVLVVFSHSNEDGNVTRAKRNKLQPYFTSIFLFILGIVTQAVGIAPYLGIRKVELRFRVNE